MQGLITWLLEAIHGQWINRNLTIHDKISGLISTKSKEQLLDEIDKQMELGGDGLAVTDQWMLQVNLGDLEVTTGDFGNHWLLAIETAQERYRLWEQNRGPYGTQT